MKTEEFVRKDGTTGTKYIPEAGDVYTSRYASVNTTKAGEFDNHSLGVTTTDGQEIYLKITGGQKKTLDKDGDLTDQKIVFYKYENQYGEQVGATVDNK